MKSPLITATALGLILASPTLADNHDGAKYLETPAENELQASNLMGMRIYATENEIADDAIVADGGEQEWNDIGEVNDLVLSRDGSVQAVVLGVGGFLGIGEKDVAIDMSNLKFVSEQDDPGEFFLVVNSSKQMLEEAPAFRSREMEEQAEAMEEQREEMEAQQEQMADAAMTPEEEQADSSAPEEQMTETSDEQTTGASDEDMAERTMLTPPSIEREGYQEARVEDLTAEMLEGRTVYGPDDESVGDIGQLIINDGGQITQAIIDVGGFLGLGEKNVAVSFDELRIMRDESGADLRLYIDSSDEQLEQLPAYEG